MVNNLKREDTVKIILFFFRVRQERKLLAGDCKVCRFIIYVNYELIDVLSIVT